VQGEGKLMLLGTTTFARTCCCGRGFADHRDRSGWPHSGEADTGLKRSAREISNTLGMSNTILLVSDGFVDGHSAAYNYSRKLRPVKSS
jgi:hypothetical protein